MEEWSFSEPACSMSKSIVLSSNLKEKAAVSLGARRKRTQLGTNEVSGSTPVLAQWVKDLVLP